MGDRVLERRQWLRVRRLKADSECECVHKVFSQDL